MITKVQKKLVEEIYGKGDFYEVEDILYFVAEDAKTYRVDFDNKVYKRMDGSKNSKDTTLNKKKIEENEAENEYVREDITPAQVKEHYYVETPETKMDSSFAMYETRVAKEMEARGISREQARIEVKNKLRKQGINVINTEDIADEVIEEDIEDTEDAKEDFAEELETLKKENEKLKTDLIEAQKVNTDMKSDFKEITDFYQEMKKEREAEVEQKRQDKIKQLVTDFVGLTEESLKDDTIEDLLKTEERLNMAITKRVDTKEGEIEIKPEDKQRHMDMIDAKAEKLKLRYAVDV
jgi:hypothetical protein